MNQKARNEITKLYYSQLIVVWAIRIVIVCCIILSVFSLMQTESSYRPMNDAGISIFGIQVGLYISLILALVTQYVQNVALYAKRHMCTGETVFDSELPIIGEVSITDKGLADLVFWVSATIDGMTNVLWFYVTVEFHLTVLGVMLAIIGYTAMVALVFVEEAVGYLLEMHRKASKQLKEISVQEKRARDKDKQESYERPEKTKEYATGKEEYHRPVINQKPFAKPQQTRQSYQASYQDTRNGGEYKYAAKD